jgi:hypothetical protein
MSTMMRNKIKKLVCEDRSITKDTKDMEASTSGMHEMNDMVPVKVDRCRKD